MGKNRTRTPRNVIDDAIAEARPWDIICRCGVVVFGLTGCVAILVGVFYQNPWVGLAATAPSGLCYAALRQAAQIRRGNQSLRLMELALAHATTAEEDRRYLCEVFKITLTDEGEADAVVPRPEAPAPKGGA